MPFDEQIIHTLMEVGIDHPNQLKNFIEVDIVRYGRKLIDLRKRMEVAWADFQEGISPSQEVDLDIDIHAEGIAK